MKKILIIGAGVGGERLLGEILRGHKEIKVVGFLDDNNSLQGKTILGVKVLGKIKNIGTIVQQNKIQEVIIAIPSLRGNRLAEIVTLIKKAGLPFKVLPGVFESIEYLTKKQVRMGKLRDLELEDLLNREPITLDLEKVSGYLKDKIVLITGAGGSIGSELARQVVQFNPQKLILIDIYENNLYELGNELKNISCETIVADVKDIKTLKKIFQRYKPAIVFHAAAHKHVPLMEQEPQEAVKNNILGTANLIELAIDFKIGKFIFISTDKAINPTSIMGATKRFSEEHIRSLNAKEPIFIIVRFGNVLGSYGSVIPLWKKQLLAGQPLTVTHAAMKRYFMTIPEAVQLVIQAGSMAKENATYVLKMGKQYKIIDLAYDLIKLYGLIPEKDAKIVITRPRPGEKLSETLYDIGESIQSSSHKMIAKIRSNKKIQSQKIQSVLRKFHQSIDNLSRKEIVKMLKKIIPTYIPYQEIETPKKISELINFSPPSIGAEEKEAILEVLDSGWLTMGQKVLEFEKKFAQFHNIDEAIAVNSATAGLHLALLSLGVGIGDEVILPSYTFASCANTVCWTDAKPVFADITKEGFLIDPVDIARKITKKTKAIMAVHFGGQMAEMDEIRKIAQKYHLKIIEDCAHSPGARYKDKLAGTIGDIGVFSFYATKNMTTGEGGVVITNNSDLAEKMSILRLHGMSANAFDRYSNKGKWYYEITEAGFKYNMTDLEAAMGLVQLARLPALNKKRSAVVEQYLRALDGTGLILPHVLPNRENVWHLFPILVDPTKRNLLIEKLGEFNVSTSVHFIPLHLQPFYQKKFGYKKGDLPVSEWVYEREISLPIYPELSDVSYITKVIKYLVQNV